MLPSLVSPSTPLQFKSEAWAHRTKTRGKTSLLHSAQVKSTHLLPFCWRTRLACSRSMCTSLVTKECPSPWLKGGEISPTVIWEPSTLARTGWALEPCIAALANTSSAGFHHLINTKRSTEPKVVGISPQYCGWCGSDSHLEKTGSIQYFARSPNTSVTFRLQPSENPLLSRPFVKTGALKVSSDW